MVANGTTTTADENGVDYHIMLHKGDNDNMNHNLRRRLGGKDKNKNKDKDKDDSNEDRNTGGGGGAIGGGAIGGGGDAGSDKAVLNPNGFDGLPCTSWSAFVDKQGNDCVQYDLNPLWCGLVANQNKREDGLDANWACCICGGGDYANPGSTIQNNP